MLVVEVAVPCPLPRTFTYRTDQTVPVGSRVVVPFGRRRLVGVALGPGSLVEGVELKAIESVIDETPVYSKTLLDLARWISVYYMHPIGEVLRSMLPASGTQSKRETYTLTEDGEKTRRDASPPDGRLLAALFGKKKTEMAAASLRNRHQKLVAAGDGDAAAVSLRALKKRGLIASNRGTNLRPRASGEPTVAEGAPEPAPPAAEAPPPLTPQQAAAFAAMVEPGLEVAAGSSRVYLLHGVTGSGKTEVYLRLIGETLQRSAGLAQTLVLVPEISLTPQMTRVFERRFPGQVAVVHSAMMDAERWAQLNRIRSGEAKILIGPRSAVFGPFQKLGLLLVDEEHDGSYKQSSGLTYNGRDVAVLRGRMEGATVVLGSATPSMETYLNALNGRYTLLELKDRVTGRALPEVEIVMTEPGRRKGALVSRREAPRADEPAADTELPIDARVITALRNNLAAGHQAIVLVNRRGYAYYLFSVEERKAVQCPSCSISLTLHARSTVLRCHYCDFSTSVAKVLAEHPQDTFVAVGYGSQKAEDYLAAKLPEARIVRIDSDSVVQRDVLPRTLARFRSGEIDILVGTQILAKGHDFPKVTLIVLLEVDQLLGLPDFRAGERTFQLIVQAAGRAGRAELAGRVLIQTLRASHPVVTAAIRQDYRDFAERELRFRKIHAYPPFARMIALEFNATSQSQLEKLVRGMEEWLEGTAARQPAMMADVRVLGPAVPQIETIRGRHRRTVVFTSDKIEPLRGLVSQFLDAFQKLPRDVRLKIDVDPQSLL